MGLSSCDGPRKTRSARVDERAHALEIFAACRRRSCREPSRSLLIRMPCSSARSCSSASARSIAVGGSAASRSRRRAAVDVEADVRPGRRRRLAGARERDRRAREIQREAVAVDDDLGDVRIRAAPRRRRCARRSVLISSAGSAANGATAASIISGAISGSSPWTLTMRSQVERRRRLRRADRCRSGAPPTSSPPRRRNRWTASRIRRSSVATITRAIERGRGGAPVDVLDHRAAGDVGQRLARETGRLVPRGDDGDCRDGSRERGRPGVRNRGHDNLTTARFTAPTPRLITVDRGDPRPCSSAACVSTARPAPMTVSRTAFYGVGGALLVAYLAAANMPSQDPAARSRAAQASREPSTDALADRRPRAGRPAARAHEDARRSPRPIPAIRFRSACRRAAPARGRRPPAPRAAAGAAAGDSVRRRC